MKLKTRIGVLAATVAAMAAVAAPAQTAGPQPEPPIITEQVAIPIPTPPLKGVGDPGDMMRRVVGTGGRVYIPIVCCPD